MNYFSISKFLLYLVPFLAIIVTPSVHFPYITGKFVFFRFVVGFALIFFLLGIIFDDKRTEEYWSKLMKAIRSPLGIALGVFTFIFLLSGFFGVDPANSFWSNYERGEGGLQILFLYIFFILLTTLFRKKEDWIKFIKVFVGVAFLSVLYGLAVGLGWAPGDGKTLSEINRFGGSLGNPAYYATYLLFAMFFSFYLLLSKNLKISRVQRNLLIFCIIVFSIFFLWAATRGAFLGLIGAGIVGSVYLFVKEKKWRLPIAGVVLLVGLFLGVGYIYKDTDFVQDLPISRLYEINLETKNMQERLIMWNMSIEAVKERPLLGWGPENFNHIFYKYYNPEHYNPAENGVANYGSWFDRAHSTTFDYLSQTGILGLLSYWGIFIVFFIMFFRSKIYKKESAILAALLLMLPVGYLIQGQVLFEVLTIYMPFYIFIAFAGYLLKEKKEKHV